MYENKIVGTVTEHPEQLLANPNNWRIHPKGQQDALESLLDDVGWVQNIIVNQRTGHVVDGHMRAAVAISQNQTEIPVVYVDLTEEEERKVLASLDPIGAMAVTDNDALRELLIDVDASGALQTMLENVATDFTQFEDQDDAAQVLDKMPLILNEPRNEVANGDVFMLGDNVLIVADLIHGVSHYLKYLTDDVLFFPYPSPYMPASPKFRDNKCVLVQPIQYYAAHLLDIYETLNPTEQLRRAN